MRTVAQTWHGVINADQMKSRNGLVNSIRFPQRQMRDRRTLLLMEGNSTPIRQRKAGTLLKAIAYGLFHSPTILAEDVPLLTCKARSKKHITDLMDEFSRSDRPRAFAQGISQR